STEDDTNARFLRPPSGGAPRRPNPLATLAVRCKLAPLARQTVRPMLNIRSPIFLAAGLVIVAAVAAAQSPTAPMKMLDDVRDRRYCELIVIKRHGVGFSADVYNTLGLNDCPQAAWDAIDTAKVASQFDAFRVIRNGPRRFIMDRLASGDADKSAADIQGLAMRPVATLSLRLFEFIGKR